MKWEAKKQPELGDLKYKKRFAFLPVRIDSKWIWLEKYFSEYKYCEYYYNIDVVVSQGIFTEKYYTKQEEAIGWLFKKRILNKPK